VGREQTGTAEGSGDGTPDPATGGWNEATTRRGTSIGRRPRGSTGVRSASATCTWWPPWASSRKQRGDFAGAEGWLRTAAGSGHTLAMFNLGRLLRRRGDAEEAESWYRRAAEAGQEHAMASLAVLLDGRGGGGALVPPGGGGGGRGGDDRPGHRPGWPG
jgi:hypothetical protein